MRAFRHIIILGAVALPLSFSAQPVSTNSPPLPTLEEIFPRVAERADHERENDRAFEARFSFVKTRLTETLNGKGEVKKREEKISTNNPALKKPAAPPAAGPARAPEKTPPVADGQPKGRAKAYEKDEFQVDDDLLKRFEFTLVGREMVNGRPALVVDFVPAKGKLPERNLKEKFINRTAGRVWLDEQDYAMAKLAIRLTDRVNVIGGLVGAVWKLNFGFERERTQDGLWYSRDVVWHLEGRELFAQRTMNYHETRTGVRPAP